MNSLRLTKLAAEQIAQSSISTKLTLTVESSIILVCNTSHLNSHSDEISHINQNKYEFLGNDSIFTSSTHGNKGEFSVFIHPDTRGFTINLDQTKPTCHQSENVNIKWLDTFFTLSNTEVDLLIIDHSSKNDKNGIQLSSPYANFNVGLVWLNNKPEQENYDQIVFRGISSK